MATDTPMQLGMVGLGRMGANLVRRLMRDGHHCVGTDVGAETVAGLAAEGMTGAANAKELVAALEAPRTVWVMVPAGDITERAIAELADAALAGRHDHRRRQHPVPRRHPPRAGALRAGPPLRRLRDERRRLRVGARLLPDDRRRGRGGLAARAALHVARTGSRDDRADARSLRRSDARGARLAPLRPGRRGTFREDGPQRDRVRPDGGVRGGPQRPPPRERRRGRRARRTPRPRRSSTPSSTATTSTSRQSPRSGGADRSSRRGSST